MSILTGIDFTARKIFGSTKLGCYFYLIVLYVLRTRCLFPLLRVPSGFTLNLFLRALKLLEYIRSLLLSVVCASNIVFQARVLNSVFSLRHRWKKHEFSSIFGFGALVQRKGIGQKLCNCSQALSRGHLPVLAYVLRHLVLTFVCPNNLAVEAHWKVISYKLRQLNSWLEAVICEVLKKQTFDLWGSLLSSCVICFCHVE